MATEGHKPTDCLFARDAAVLPGTSSVLEREGRKEPVARSSAFCWEIESYSC